MITGFKIMVLKRWGDREMSLSEKSEKIEPHRWNIDRFSLF
jgi:hypothetical protein